MHNKGIAKIWLLAVPLALVVLVVIILASLFIYSKYFQKVDITYNSSKYKIALNDKNALDSYISKWLVFDNAAAKVWLTLPEPQVKQTPIHKLVINFVDSQPASFQISTPEVNGNLGSFSSFLEGNTVYITINPDSGTLTAGADTNKWFSEAVIQSIRSVINPTDATNVNLSLTESGNIHNDIQNSNKPIFTIRKI